MSLSANTDVLFPTVVEFISRSNHLVTLVAAASVNAAVLN